MTWTAALRYIFQIIKGISCQHNRWINKKPDGLTSSAATLTLGPEIGLLGNIIEIHLKVHPISMLKKKMIQNQWKLFEKMTDDLKHDLLWAQMTWNMASEADIQHTSKSSLNWHVNQDWCETGGKFLRKLPKTRILTYLEAQSGPKIGLLRPIFSTPLKVLALSMCSNIDVKPR